MENFESDGNGILVVVVLWIGSHGIVCTYDRVCKFFCFISVSP